VDEKEMPFGKALRLWTKAGRWQAPVSLGLVKPGESSKFAWTTFRRCNQTNSSS
jgi:anti-sigma-K factor RskA